MFLSTENPPNDPLPSSSSSSIFLHHLNTSSSHELGLSHLPNFSIRDYAFSNRKKNINNNWPFSSKSLHLFSTHGVTDPLPPFQQFSTVTTKVCSSSEKQILPYVHQGSDLAKQTKKRAFSRNGLCVSKSEVVATTSTKNNNQSKKCGGRGMVKSKEDSLSINGLVTTTCESTMASKTCPICKTFSSASNTTLNAHIDQCLSVVDSALLPPVCSKPSKPKSSNKPKTKVKTMVDIYAYAKGCTLEDLDKRNGTKWASILSYSTTNRVLAVAAADKTQVLSKKRKVSPVGVGPVYIDAKGQKLRILSEFGEKKKKTSTTNTPLKKNRQVKKHDKFVKLTNQKANVSEKIHGEGSHMSHRRIYNQRMLAKSGLISKKLNENGHKFYALEDQPSENEDDSWSGEDHIVSRSTDLSASSSYLSNKQKLKKKKKSIASTQEDKSLPVKRFYCDVVEVSDASPNATNMRKLSPPFVPNAWRRQSMPMELKKARLDFSDEEDETGKWESEMTQERELSDDDYVSDDNRGNDYNDDDNEEETSEEEEEDNNKTDDMGAEFYQLDSPQRSMYYSEEVGGNVIYGQTSCKEDVRFDSEVGGRGSLFVEVDTIPIPGPPGSFLPSPRDMCFDENLGNSSVITSQVQSSMDRNSSESPVSAVSNFAAGRLSFPTELSSSSFRETFSPVSFCVPSYPETTTIEKTTTRFRNNDQESCCCQRKEGITLNHQASHLLQRRAITMNLTKSPSRLEPNIPFEQSPYNKVQQDLDVQSKFSSRSVVPPSPSNPVLRLMGKDLMVMNQGEAEEETPQSSLTPTSQFLDPTCAGTGLYFNTGLYLRTTSESTHQPQASAFRNNFDHVRYFSPS